MLLWLSTRQDRALRLHCGDGLSYEEIAARMGIGRTTAKSYLVACYQRLGVETGYQACLRLGMAEAEHRRASDRVLRSEAV